MAITRYVATDLDILETAFTASGLFDSITKDTSNSVLNAWLDDVNVLDNKICAQTCDITVQALTNNRWLANANWTVNRYTCGCPFFFILWHQMFTPRMIF